MPDDRLVPPARLVHALLLVPVYLACTLTVIRWLAPRLFPGESLMAGGPHTYVAILIGTVVDVGLVVGVGLFAVGRLRPRDIGWVRVPIGRTLALGVASFLASSAIFLALMALVGDSPRDAIAEALAYGPKQRIPFILVGIEAALTEESIYRGYLQGTLARHIPTTAAIVVTAAVFALAHMRFSPVALAFKFFPALLLGALRGRDRPLAAPAIVHFLTWAVWGFV